MLGELPDFPAVVHVDHADELVGPAGGDVLSVGTDGEGKDGVRRACQHSGRNIGSALLEVDQSNLARAAGIAARVQQSPPLVQRQQRVDAFGQIGQPLQQLPGIQLTNQHLVITANGHAPVVAEQRYRQDRDRVRIILGRRGMRRRRYQVGK